MSDRADPNASAASAGIDGELAALEARGQAAVVISGSGDRVLWATGAGAALFGVSDPAALARQTLDPALTPVRRFAELAAAQAPAGGVRLERLRITANRRVELVTFACRPATLANGEAVLVAIAMNGPARLTPFRPMRAASPPPAFAATPAAEPEPALVDAAALRARFDGRALARFTWRTDAQGLLEDISSDFARVVGAHAPAIGADLADLRGFGAQDRDGALPAALARRQTFTGVDVVWPVERAEGGVLVTLSGVPSFNRAREFQGYRGFGVVHLDELVPLADEDAAPDAGASQPLASIAEAAPQGAASPPADAPAAPVSSPAEATALVAPAQPIAPVQRDILSLSDPAPQSTALTVETVREHAASAADAPPDESHLQPATEDASAPVIADTAADEAPAFVVAPPIAVEPPPAAVTPIAPTSPAVPTAPTAPAQPPRPVLPFAVRGSAHATLAAGKVVPLRSGPVGAPAGVLGGPGLSRSERNAFREIARALGARVEGEESAGEPPQPLPPFAPADADLEASTADEAFPADAPEAETEQLELNVEAEPPVDADAPAPETSVVEHDGAAAQAPTVDEPNHAAPAELVSDLARHAESIFDRLPIGVIVSRGEVPIVMNRTLLDLLGYETVDDFHRESGLDGLFRGRPAESLSANAEGSTVMLTARDGDTIAVDARLQTIMWDDLPATLMSFRRAVETETLPKLKAMELDLKRRSNDVRELRAILDTATDGVIVLDEAGRILSVNKAGEALFGYDQNEVAGETFITLFAPDSHALALDYLEGLKANGVASVLNDGREVVGRVRQGGRIPLFMTLGAISDAPERKFCAVLRDITPWKKAETDLMEAKRAAEHASAQKSDFLAKISHEVRTPLSAIIGFAEVMIEERFGPIGNERYLEYLRDIHASGGHVISLVNDLLDLSKIEAGKFDLNFISVDANEIVSRSVAMMQPQAGAGRVVLRTSLSQRLPRVVADERALRQIVLNILSNAVKFTDPGGQVIVSTAFTDRGEVALRVRDTGIGMSEKEIETALEPFRQVSATRRGGTGLGLPLTKALVEANRASLTIRSAKDAGTLVEVTFPTTRVLSE
ncbi:hypothetical protein GCM10007036_08560 [Alsobacter metallidurans]|uniref:histidine kinase n=1 Tax=Alsobacter metallidurans TaxID=340221 RepID=A0A917I4C0_9HYPH|nr:ATP-binding protein [Alsobacter metallidurans]GGH11477.1 hypothetical protein GCM10007036_08560 [Alsobacter metallidurans]